MWLRDLFEPEPDQWGLRGDPYLWQELKEQLGMAPAPDTEQELVALLGRTIKGLLGEPFTMDGQLYVERFAHGGMSSSSVSGDSWLRKGITHLVERCRTPR